MKSIAVIGLGAIGGSVAWQARRAGVRVVGYSPDVADAAAAERSGAVSTLALRADAAVARADLVVLAAPPAATLELISALAGSLEPTTVLSDVASVKECVIARACAAGLDHRFAGAHPLAGTHGSGFGYASPDLLRGCVVYICPTGAAGAEAARQVAGFWTGIMGSTPVQIEAVEHDRQLGWTSHLPQGVAYALARVLAERGYPAVAYGPGARDTTRLAASSPDLWVDIFLQNREAVVEALGDAAARVQELRDLLGQRDEAGLRRFMTRGSAFRRSLER